MDCVNCGRTKTWWVGKNNVYSLICVACEGQPKVGWYK